tara:strand:+ start:26858 stop:27628 length:771 start_codon:yes stop_codon:yes gene_type:complete
MSTILKALEKSQHEPHVIVIDKSMDTRWKLLIAAALLVIAILLTAVVFLLFKPTEDKVSAVSIIAEPAPLLPSVVVTKPISLVSEVDFKTKPLPKTNILHETQQKWVSAEKSIVNNTSENTSENEIIANSNTNNEVVNSTDLDDVSSDLQRRFELAVELEQGEYSERSEVINEQPLVASDISTMPAKFQYQVPVMRYDSHMYSSEAKDRWIRINGIDLRTGEYIGAVELVDILPQKSVFRLGKQSFTLESLQDWKG